MDRVAKFNTTVTTSCVFHGTHLEYLGSNIRYEARFGLGLILQPREPKPPSPQMDMGNYLDGIFVLCLVAK